METYNNNFSLSNKYNSDNAPDESELRFGKIYHIIDAFIDTVNLAPNRKNALKYGVRAIGEIMSEFPHEKEEHIAKELPDQEIPRAHPEPIAPSTNDSHKTPGRG